MLVQTSIDRYNHPSDAQAEGYGWQGEFILIFKNKFLSFALVTIFAIIFAPACLKANQVHVTINGRQVNFIDQGPTIVDGRTLVPVRSVFEELGFEVDWEQDTETARLTRSGYEVVLTIGSANFITNGESHALDVPAQIMGSRTMLPIRAVLESVGYSVDWIQATNTVSISSSGMYGNRFSHSDGIDENGFWKGITALDYVEIFNYDNLGIPNDVHYVSDEQVELEIQNRIHQLSRRKMQRAVVKGDSVNIDYVASIDGHIFESERDVYVYFGDIDFIDDFLEKLIGHMPGDTVHVKMTLPDDEPEFRAGEDALFVVTINFIFSEEPSSLTDEYVFKNLYDYYGWTTISEMEEGIRREFQELSIRIFVENYIRNEVNVSSIPEKLIRYLEQSLISSFKEIASNLDITFEEYVEMIGYGSVDELLKETREMLKLGGARRSLILQAVAEHGGFSVSIEEVEDFFEENFGTRDYSSLEEELGRPYIINVVLHQKIIDHIVKNAVLL